MGSIRSKYKAVNNLIGLFLWKSKKIITKSDDTKLRTQDILQNEEALMTNRNELQSMKTKVDNTNDLLHKTIIEFSNLQSVFTGLSKSIADFQDEMPEQTSELQNVKAKGESVSFNFLKKSFDSTSENFEQLTLEYHTLIKMSENLSTDISEMVDIIDSFIRNKEETIDKIYSNYVI